MANTHAFELILRIIIFALALYYLLEFVYMCNVSNWIGFSLLITILIVVCILYIVFRGQNIKRCGRCKQHISRGILEV